MPNAPSSPSIPSPSSTRVLICAADLVGRVGLGALLEEEASVAVTGKCAPDDDLGAALALALPDVVLWDTGWAIDADLLAPLSDLADDGPPLLALIADAEDATAIWRTGVRGLLPRDAAPATLAAACVALAHGLTLFDPTFTAIEPPQLSPGPPDWMEPLTPRELEVLQALAQGLSNKLIAQQLVISEHTVKFHLNAILGKLGAQSRTEAVVLATRAGLIRL